MSGISEVWISCRVVESCLAHCTAVSVVRVNIHSACTEVESEVLVKEVWRKAEVHCTSLVA